MEALNGFKRDKYTGENRCTPCTVVNVTLATIFAGVVAVVVGASVGIAFFLVALALIYFRGYLLPGTPTLTKRYLPASVLELFGKEPVGERAARSIDADTATEEQLVAVGALTDDEAPVLTDSFATAWETAIEGVRSEDIDESVLRTLFGTDDVSRHAATGAVIDGNQSIRWISESALIADVAAGRLLAERDGGWETLSPSDRIALLRSLRLFIRVCPTCDGSVDVAERTVDPCCERPHTLIEVVCSDCKTPLADDAVVGIDDDVPGRFRAIRA